MKPAKLFKTIVFSLFFVIMFFPLGSNAEVPETEECVIEESENGEFVYDEQCLEKLDEQGDEAKTLKDLVEQALGRSIDENSDD